MRITAYVDNRGVKFEELMQNVRDKLGPFPGRSFADCLSGEWLRR